MDILMNDNGIALTSDGNFIKFNGDNQQAYYILNSTYNYFKYKPLYALNFIKKQNGSYSERSVRKDIKEILQLDGFNRIEMDTKDLNNINVNASR